MNKSQAQVCSTLNKCRVCRKCFTNKRHLARHQIANKISKCLVCQKAFCDRTKRDTHELTHQKQRPKCNVCETGFKTEAARMKHLRTHKGSMPFTCKYCDRDFSEEHELTFHEMTHREYPLFKCRFCGKAFGTKYSCGYHEDHYHIFYKHGGNYLLRKTLVTNFVNERWERSFIEQFEEQAKVEDSPDFQKAKRLKADYSQDAKAQEQISKGFLQGIRSHEKMNVD